MKIELGNVGSDSRPTRIYIDVDVLLRTRLLVQANSGGGKSWLLRLLAEQLFGKVQVILIDPEGEFATLREKYGYVLVGRGGETPSDTRSAALLAEKLLETRACAICDLYEMKPLDRHRWVRMFLGAMIDAPKKFWHPTVIIVDEAHQFCPEKGSGESEASDEMIALATRGRKRGFCGIFATQRLGKLRKDLAAELTNVMIGMTTIDIDRKRAADALGIYGTDQRKFFDDVKKLRPGQFYALGRAIGSDRVLVNIGPVQTSHPEPGQDLSFSPPPTPDAIKYMLPKLADLPKAAEEQARTVADLKKEIRELKAARVKPVVDESVIKREADRVRKELQGEISKRDAVINQLTRAIYSLSETAAKVSQKARPGEIVSERHVTKPIVGKVVSTGLAKPPKIDPKGQKSIMINNRHESMNGELPVGEKAILKAAAQYDDGARRDQLTVLTGYKRSSRDAYIARLRAKELVGMQGDLVVATETGKELLGSDYEPLPTGLELREYWLRRLPEGERRILEILLDAGGDAAQREELDERTGYKRSSRDAYLSRLSARRLVELVGRGSVKASETLFE